MSRLDDILAQLRDALPGLRERYAVRSLAVFGSVARGEAGPASDVDVLVEFEPAAKVTLLTLAGVQNELEDLLGGRVDIVENHPRLRPSFRAKLDRDLVRVA